MKKILLVGGVVFTFFMGAPTYAEDPFAAGVRTTDPLTPEAEQQSFSLPPGFEIQLVASEPEIQKPINMAFDARGRLWITDTVEYPYPAPPDRKGRDTIKILEDTNGDGRADRVVTFADGLNIPIGLYPYKNGVIAYSIPNIYFFEDVDGDDRADRQTKLFGPFDYSRDTHGMQNAFRRGLDGWLYACHGFNNQSSVQGADGHVVTMHSGNTYRMRLDGSRLEHFTWGQVNPFGMAQDPLGNLFTADCHSKPIYLLIRDGYYPSFGKPHDGLGFVPPIMHHLHGSTAIAGVVYYDDDHFPAEYRGNLFSGNVMTSRVNRNSLIFHGSTITAHEEPDFIRTTDPWFRPVDIQLAPDGSLYVADFYNRIIGHYEVPLDHPGRDRHRGRIWRVVYRGENGASSPRDKVDLARADTETLIAELGSPNLTQRMRATDEVTDRIGPPAIPALRAAFLTSDNAKLRAHALGALFRLNACDTELLEKAAADADRTVRIHSMKILAETGEWTDSHRRFAIAGLRDSDAFVQRAAADALGQHPHAAHIQPLLELLDRTPENDVLLRHTARIALRNQFRNGQLISELAKLDLTDQQRRRVAEVLIAAPSAESAAFLLNYLERYTVDAGEAQTFLEHIARHLSDDQVSAAISFARKYAAGDVYRQQELLRSIRHGLAQRGITAPETLRRWALELAAELLDLKPRDEAAWTNTPVAGASRHGNPWVVQQRSSADGDTRSRFLCSLPRGEQLTGSLRSPEFVIPQKLAFYCAGHIGPPGQPVVVKNFVRLRDAETSEILVESRPPSDDTAQRIEWDLASHAGRRGYLEIVDGDDRNGFAWLAVGRFHPEVVSIPTSDPSEQEQRCQIAAQLATELNLNELVERLIALLSDARLEPASQSVLAKAVLVLRPDPILLAIAPVLDEPGVSMVLRQRVLQAIERNDPSEREAVLIDAFQQSPQRLQAALALGLSSTAEGSIALVSLAERGIAAPRLLTFAGAESRMANFNIEGLQERIKRLTESLPPANETLRQLIEQRKQRHLAANPSPERGAAVFEKHCAVCHQLSGKGALIGPQLDGIGNRGLERLLEDVLAPNQNVDVAFRVSSFVMADGRVLSGLMRREEGKVLIVVDSQGKEFKLAKDDIEEQRSTNLSLMPENVAEIVPEEDFHHLISYLLQQRGEPAPTP